MQINVTIVSTLRATLTRAAGAVALTSAAIYAQAATPATSTNYDVAPTGSDH